MKGKYVGLGIFGMIFRFLGQALEVIVEIIVYTGLYYPIFYLTVVLGLYLWGGMTFEPSIELNLFYVGLAISLACAVVVTLRRLIFEPFGAFLDRRREKRDEEKFRKRMKDLEKQNRELRDARHRRDRAYMEEQYRDRNSGYYNRREYNRPDDYYDDKVMTRRRQERPHVYRSSRDRSLIIYEYQDRFEVYRDTPNGLRHIDTRRK